MKEIRKIVAWVTLVILIGFKSYAGCGPIGIVYSYPVVNECEVDVNINTFSFLTDYSVDSYQEGVRMLTGFFNLYKLSDSTLLSSVDINTLYPNGTLTGIDTISFPNTVSLNPCTEYFVTLSNGSMESPPWCGSTFTYDGWMEPWNPAIGVQYFQWKFKTGGCAPGSAILSGGGTICEGDNIPNLQIDLTGTPPWQIYYTNGTNTYSTTAESSPHIIENSPEGTYSLVSATDCQGNCSVNGSAAININPIPIDPIVNIANNGSTAFCTGQDITLSVNQTNNATYQWQLDNVNITGANNFNYTTPNNSSADGGYQAVVDLYGCPTTSNTIVVSTFEINNTINDVFCGSYSLNGQTYNLPGTYTQTLSNGAGCDSTITLNLTVNPSQFSPDFTVSSNLFSAPPFAAQFNNTTPNPSNYNFTWDFSDGTILQSNNSLVFHEYLYNGLYDVTLIAEDINSGCTDTIFYDDYIFCTGGNSCTHASTINQTGPITACVSDSVFLSCNTGSNFTYQWRLNGTYIPGAVDTIYYPTQTGNYSVLIMDNGCPEVSPDVSVVISSSPQTPIITSSGNITPCLGGSVTLSVPATYSSYNWSSGGTSSSEVVNSSGSYFVTVSNSTGCEVSSPIYTINASFATPPDVCIVGVDSITNYNKVVWEKPISTAIDSFYVYKESNQANIYQKIGGTSYSDTAVFNDLSSNPAAQAYRYKLSLVDSCGIESSLGSMHKSIHLTINQGVGTTWNLIWSHYEGFTFPSYNIYSGTSSTNMTLLTTIASNLNSYTDLTAPAGQLYYQIEVVSNYTCDPLKSNYNVSRSNVVDNAEAPSIIVQNQTSNVNVFPNPTQDQITIDIKGYTGVVNVAVYDLQGRLLETTTNTIVSLKKHAKGIYVLKVSYGEITEMVRVVRD